MEYSKNYNRRWVSEFYSYEDLEEEALTDELIFGTPSEKMEHY